jgi:hypothetical protein
LASSTEKPIGSVEIPKVIVEVSRVEPLLAVARTFKKRQRNIGGTGLTALGIGNIFDPPKWVDEWESLRTEKKPEIKELPESASYVQRGDPVVQVLGDEYLTSD